jgi:YHS domain-containing protein
MGRFLLYLALIWIAYLLFKKFAKSLNAPQDRQGTESGGPPADAELIRDPQCGVYFMKQRGVKGVVDGKVLHFCSEECYDKYVKDHARR